MLSVTERTAPAKPLTRHLADTFQTWNRKLHFYTGLYLLFFLWLFAFTGLLLNHPAWTFAEFWPNRKQSSFERPIQPLPHDSDLAQAKNIMRQLGIEGEIEWTRARSDSSRLEFQATRPGHNYQIQADLTSNLVELHADDLNTWGVMHVLHTFTGVRIGDPKNHRDWTLTTVWALSMDALAVGLIFMVLSSLYMWYGLNRKRTLGLLTLVPGVLGCGLFIVGLRWITN
jgi:hypothetical protein